MMMINCSVGPCCMRVILYCELQQHAEETGQLIAKGQPVAALQRHHVDKFWAGLYTPTTASL